MKEPLQLVPDIDYSSDFESTKRKICNNFMEHGYILPLFLILEFNLLKHFSYWRKAWSPKINGGMFIIQLYCHNLLLTIYSLDS